MKSDNISSKIQTFSFNSKTQSQSTFSKADRRQSFDETTVDIEYEDEEEDYGTDLEQKELMKSIMTDNLKLNLNFLDNNKSLSSSGTKNCEEEETFGSSSSLSGEEGVGDLDNTFSSEEMSPNW